MLLAVSVPPSSLAPCLLLAILSWFDSFNADCGGKEGGGGPHNRDLWDGLVLAGAGE